MKHWTYLTPFVLIMLAYPIRSPGQIFEPQDPVSQLNVQRALHESISSLVRIQEFTYVKFNRRDPENITTRLSIDCDLDWVGDMRTGVWRQGPRHFDPQTATYDYEFPWKLTYREFYESLWEHLNWSFERTSIVDFSVYSQTRMEFPLRGAVSCSGMAGSNWYWSRPSMYLRVGRFTEQIIQRQEMELDVSCHQTFELKWECQFKKVKIPLLTHNIYFPLGFEDKNYNRQILNRIVDEINSRIQESVRTKALGAIQGLGL